MSLRNSSELPVMIHRAELALTPWGYNLVQADAGPESYSDKEFGVPRTIFMFLGETIEPESTQEDPRLDPTNTSFGIPQASQGLYQPNRCKRRYRSPVGYTPNQSKATKTSLLVEAQSCSERVWDRLADLATYSTMCGQRSSYACSEPRRACRWDATGRGDFCTDIGGIHAGQEGRHEYDQ